MVIRMTAIQNPQAAHEVPLRVMALHALAYCQRLFYLEEVEEIRVADARVFAGRELHAGLDAEDDGEWTSIELTSQTFRADRQNRLHPPPRRSLYSLRA